MLFILRRILSGLILILAVTAITFWVSHLNTDAVVAAVLGVSAQPSEQAAKSQELGFDQPIYAQYFDWLVAAAHGDLGRSLYTDEPVFNSLSTRFPVTLSIVVLTVLLTAILSVALGVAAALRRGVVDRMLQGVTLLGHIVPPLLFAIALVIIFAINLRWLPATGFVPFATSPRDWLASVTLPTIALTIGGVAAVAAQVRGGMLDELSKDYIKTLRSRGMSPRAIVYGHALRNAGGPALTTLSLLFIGLLGGAIIIEQIFALPGFGAYAFTASIQSDLPAIMGVVAFTVVMVVVMNLIVDILQGWLNPKARAS